jgi:hypothetical protein
MPSAKIRDNQRRVHPDSPPALSNSEVKLVILISHQLLIESTDSLKDVPPVRAEGHRVDPPAYETPSTKMGIPYSERMALRSGDSRANLALPYGLEPAPNALRSPTIKKIDTSLNVVLRDTTVPVHSYQDASARLVNTLVQACRS